MSVPSAYLAIILIWSTTPLAIQWSSEEVGFLFGLASRMSISAVVCLLLLIVLRQQFSWSREARHTYMASGLGLYGAMTAVYFGAQFISSGLVSVIYGLMPIVTSLAAIVILRETFWQPMKLIGSAVGFSGLVVVFDPTVLGSATTYVGVTMVFLSVTIHAVSMLWIKKIGGNIPALSVTTGGLWVATPLYLITWYVVDGVMPTAIPIKSMSSTLYLALIGSVVGFVLFYYVLKKVAASSVAVITLLTPVLALGLGHWLNDEVLEKQIVFGAILVLLGLVVHNWGGRVAAYINGKK